MRNIHKISICSSSELALLTSSKLWWRHQMETLSALLAFCAGNSPVTGEFPEQRSMTRSLDVFFNLRRNQLLSKQWRTGDLGRHRAHYDVIVMYLCVTISFRIPVWLNIPLRSIFDITWNHIMIWTGTNETCIRVMCNGILRNHAGLNICV